MRGKPKYKLGDVVKFKLDDEVLQGVIAIVDKFGTFEDPSDVSYDILNKDQRILYKHFREDFVIGKVGHIDPEKIWEFVE